MPNARDGPAIPGLRPPGHHAARRHPIARTRPWTRRHFIEAGLGSLALTAAVMGIAPEEVPTFVAAWGVGMTPTALADIEIRGAPLAEVRRRFRRPSVVPWAAISGAWGVQELEEPLPR